MRFSPALIAILGLVAACSSTDGSGGGAEVAPSTGGLHASFAASSAKAGVPRDLLVAIAKVEEGLTLPAERLELDVDNEVPAAGPLQLRRGKLDTLRRGADLVAKSELDLRRNADLALEAGALVLAELGTQSGATANDLPSWQRAIAEMSGYADAPHRDRYVHQVYATLARGGRFEGRDGEIIALAPHDLPPSLTIDVDVNVTPLAQAQYPGAEWIPTSCGNNKCSLSRSNANVQFVVVHDTEGSWNASVATLQNDPGKSVQYIIDVDGRTAQFITEETTGYHVGNFWYNQRSIGIEHVGYATKPFTEAQYVASAKLVDHLLKKYELPADRAHVIGHDQIPNGNKIAQSSAPCSSSPKSCQSSPNYGGADRHTDPGIWEWPTFMVRFGGTPKCNDVTSLINCSNDKTKGFRCVDGQVEVRTCKDKCIVQPNGVDDTCEAAPQALPPLDLEPDDQSSNTVDRVLGSKKSTPTEESEADSGCATSPRGSSSPFGVVLVGLAFAAVRRRRSRGSA